MNRLLVALFTAFLFAILAEGAFLFYLSKKATRSLTSPSTQTRPNASSVSPTYRLPFVQLVPRIDFVEGKAFKWEDIPNSSDKYLILGEEKTNKPIIKARIVFDKEAATSPAKLATGFGKRKTAESIEFEILGPAANYELSKVKDLIDRSKTVLIFPIYNNPKDTTFERDENNQMIARWLIYFDEDTRK